MPTEEELLTSMEERLKEGKERVAYLKGWIADLRAAGIDALRQEEELTKVTAELHHWEILYGLRRKRTA